MQQIINWTNFGQYGLKVGEINGLPSKTVPGQTLSIQELVKRYIRGESVEVFKGEYDADTDLPDISKMTEMDKLDFARELKETANQASAYIERKAKPKPAGGRSSDKNMTDEVEPE